MRLTFKPTIRDEDHMRLEAETEVPNDFANGVKLRASSPRLAHASREDRPSIFGRAVFALAGMLDTMKQSLPSSILSDGPFGALFNRSHG